MIAVEPNVVITGLGVTLVGFAGMLRLLPVGTCPECGHCRMERLRREIERETQAARLYGIPRCPACGRYHDPAEDHPA